MLSKKQLHVITDEQYNLEFLLGLIKKVQDKGIDVLHLRMKNRSAGEIYEIGKSLIPHLSQTKLLINDRVDVAQALGVGVQLGMSALPIFEARKLLGPDQTIGCSVHSVEEALQAEDEGADFLIYGHIFESRSKPGLPPRGLDSLKTVVLATHIPVIAIGGIQAERIHAVSKTGAQGIAVIGAVMHHPNPEFAVTNLRGQLDSATSTTVERRE